jgi:uncharacterized membrane protein (UPF0182 family)
MAAPNATSQWERSSLFLNPTALGLTDPQFGLDIGFYLFRLPFLWAIYQWLMFALLVSALATAVAYFLYRGVQYSPRGFFLSERARKQLLALFALLLALKAGGYLLETFDLVYTRRGAAIGASYADIYANLPALRVLTLLSFAVAIVTGVQIFRPGYRRHPRRRALIVAHAVGLLLYPSLLQRFRVVPNEVAAERPFIERNIKFTRLAYGLDKIESKEFPAEEQLLAADLKRNDSTIKNIRLWDPRPLLAASAQLQEIRTYYKFVDVDNDRYIIDGNYRQMMLSVRELSHQHLPSRIWINEHLTYTHGHGLVFGPVNQVISGGQPEFFIKDIPPVSTGAIKITRPEIYYGELANDYVFVKTKAQELDYPAGDQNIYTTYDGRGGVPVGSFWHKHCSPLIMRRSELFSQDITGESRILYHRQIHDRVKKITPFVSLRPRRLPGYRPGTALLIIDGYTKSDRFLFRAHRQQGINYIRNSVKAVVDAYSGTIDFYLSDARSYYSVLRQTFRTGSNL